MNDSLVDALFEAMKQKGKLGASRAFTAQDAARRSGGGNVLVDRALEGALMSESATPILGPLAAGISGLGYEGIVKPLAENVPAVNRVLAGTPFEHTATSSPSVVRDPTGAMKRLAALLSGSLIGPFVPPQVK